MVPDVAILLPMEMEKLDMSLCMASAVDMFIGDWLVEVIQSPKSPLPPNPQASVSVIKENVKHV